MKGKASIPLIDERVREFDDFQPQAREAQQEEDVERLNASVVRLNPEMAEVLEFQ
jgi:hypothetical protein